MSDLVCNYSVIRFMPFPETEEFVCVGVVLFCNKTGFFGYEIELHRNKRITNFFPEMNTKILIDGRKSFDHYLSRVKKMVGNSNDQMKLNLYDKSSIFKELVRPREGTFRFSEIRTILTECPSQELQNLYNHYVNRQFVQQQEYQESIMARELNHIFRAAAIPSYKEERLGNDLYHVRMPLVRGQVECPKNIKAIKPIDFRTDDTTKIIERTEVWCLRIQKLSEMSFDPTRFLFAISMPTTGKPLRVATESRRKLSKTKIHVEEYKQTDAIIDFAKAS